ncbi:MAG: ATP-binding cassette domain-containing protein [Patescibacteria group bacterium]
MITIKHLSKRFDTKTVISDLNFKISRGEIIGLLGPNGAGKTTTLRMLSGTLPPSSGSIEIDNRDSSLPCREVKQRIGFLPEDNPLYEDLTVEEYLDFWAAVKGLDKSNKKDAVDFVVENCGISEVYYRPINELSKGYRQRVGLSQAIMTRPEILLLDEPTEGLDPNQRHDIANLITTLGRERTVVISSHVLPEVSKICTRLIIIHQGKIVADESPENLKHLGQTSHRIEAELLGNNIIPVLEKLPEVARVVEEPRNHFIIEIKGQRDIRREVFEAAVANHWTLLTLNQKERAIEEVFSQLTTNQ